MARIGAPVLAALSRLAGRRPLYTTASLRPLDGNHQVSHEQATHDLGYRPRPLKETVTETLQWFQTNSFAISFPDKPLAGDSGPK